MTTVTCQCAATTLPALTRTDQSGAIVGCWMRLGAEAELVSGCSPDERTNEVLARRITRKNPPPKRIEYVGCAKLRCSCGRLTRAITSNINSLATPPPVSDPPDPEITFGPTACWLAIAEDGGPAEGCEPDERTWDVLERRRGIVRPHATVVLEALSSPTIPEADRAAFAQLRAIDGGAGPNSKKRKPSSDATYPNFAAAMTDILTEPSVGTTTDPAPQPDDEPPRELSLFG